MSATHEPCGFGHEKPIGQSCSLCMSIAAAEEKNRKQREKDDLAAERKRQADEAEARRKGERDIK
jgi:hypothetical protein